MKFFYSVLLCLLSLGFLTPPVYATVFMVNSQQSFDNAHTTSAMNDTIIWESGTFSDIYMNITKSNLFIASEILGGTVFNGTSRVKITGDHITLEGFQFVGGNIGTQDVINTYGSYSHFNQINIRDYTSYKYLRIRESSQYARVSFCNFENRLNLDDQNILSILVDENQPGYHKIQHCSFKNFDGTGNDMGIEPIRIGLSTQADHISRSLVEYCYFTQCNGDGEIISSKASQNVYRFNTFKNNPKAELVLRHGSEAIVYGNFFLNGKGGVRVREGQNHYIYNNYFAELDDRTIYLQNESSDPLDSISIAFNTILDCSEIILGGDGSFKPTHVTFTNNIFDDPDDALFEDPTGTESWIGNIAHGNLGIDLPSSGITVIDPLLSENSAGFSGLADSSPAINAAQAGYLSLPQFEGMDSLDTEVLFDLMGQDRPQSIADKDIGCNEYPHNILIQPIATEANTGPSYDSSVLSSTRDNLIVKDLFHLFPNPGSDQITIELNNKVPGAVTVEVFDRQGKRVKTIFQERLSSGQFRLSREIGDLAPGIYTIKASSKDDKEGIQSIQSEMFIKF